MTNKASHMTNLSHAEIDELLAKRVIDLAFEKHAGQLYGDGSPYTDHLARVAERFYPASNEWAAAWLHDIVEDTDVTLPEIGRWFGPEIERIVWHLTKIGPATKQYYERIYGSHDSRRVKLADLQDNLAHCIINLDARPNERDWMGMAKRYARYIHYLTSGEWLDDLAPPEKGSE